VVTFSTTRSRDGRDHTLQIHYAKGVDGGKIEVRLDSATVSSLRPGRPPRRRVGDLGRRHVSLGTVTASIPVPGRCRINRGIANIDWFELSAGGNSAATAAVFHLNQLGFDTLGPSMPWSRTGTLTRSTSWAAMAFSVVWRSAAQTFSTWGSNKSYYSVDFTELTRPVLSTTSGKFGVGKFTISDDRLFAQTFPSVLGYFKASRADDPMCGPLTKAFPFSAATCALTCGWLVRRIRGHLEVPQPPELRELHEPAADPLLAWAWLGSTTEAAPH